MLNVVLNVVEFGMTGREVADSARMHHQWLPDEATIEENGVTPGTLKILQDMGHKIKMGGRQGDAHSILVNPRSGVAYGINDRRSADSKASRAKAPEGTRP